MGVLYSLFKPEKNQEYELGKGEWFPICKSQNCDPFKMGELWTEDTLTTFVRKAGYGARSANEWGWDDSRIIAKHLLEWAGDDQIVLIPDSLEGADHIIRKELGFKGFRESKCTQTSIWERVTDAPLTPEEEAEGNDFYHEHIVAQIKMTTAAIAEITAKRLKGLLK